MCICVFAMRTGWPVLVCGRMRAYVCVPRVLDGLCLCVVVCVCVVCVRVCVCVSKVQTLAPDSFKLWNTAADSRHA